MTGLQNKTNGEKQMSYKIEKKIDESFTLDIVSQFGLDDQPQPTENIYLTTYKLNHTCTNVI